MDACETKTLTVEVQENLIVRNSEGTIIGRLYDCVFDELPDESND